MLKKLLLEADAVQLQVDEPDWEKALQVAAVPLVTNGTISSKYLDAIITGTKDLGAYYVFEDEKFALPHARPEEGANKLGFSLVTLKNPISINGSPDVDIIIMLSAVDSHSHIEEGLKPIFEALMEPSVREQIASAKEKEEVLALL
ncbi:PTS sugar transporter subunit IIA [Vibrio sp. 10N.247.311.51]|uniref:PTS sugar transporter subunit IIA n=1 Tax=Vibrio sp. 10N.247.311.51 TaxID=3229996 RepID=UPI0035517813